jgi:MFS family permease
MWELYALWALAGFFVADSLGPEAPWAALVPAFAFATVAIGAVGCIGGGLISRRVGERRVALVALAVSGSMCLASGLAYRAPPGVLLVFLLVWGVFVVADSPQFSALAARHAPSEYTGTALTIQNGIGFLVTTVSIQLVPRLADAIGWQWAFTVLAIGPVVGGVFTSKVPTGAAQPQDSSSD